MPAKPHAFVAMSFGTKLGKDGTPIHCNRVYDEYIAPALAAAGLQPFRADQEIRAGDIRTDTFQKLLMADLVVADLSIDDPNVWYELGVRHALRARGVVLVSGGAVPTAFDRYTDRKLRYSLKDGAPDPATLQGDQHALTKMVRETMESWHGRKVSPVYNLLPNLQEPDWKSLRIGDGHECWEQHQQWQQRLELACSSGRIGNLLVLAEEAPFAAFRAEAWIKAGVALRKAERCQFALEHLERALEVQPANRSAQRERDICLQRLGRLDEARDHHDAVLELCPADPAVTASSRPADSWQPRQVILFSGHMVDAPGRATPRFPADKVPIAAAQIAAALDQLGANEHDLAFSQAAAGGDLLFVEACQRRKVRSQVLLPFSEPELIKASITAVPDADTWCERFHAMKPHLTVPLRIMPDELGPLPNGVDPFERCNLWLLYSALAYGLDKVRFIALWNGGGGDGLGGTAHMYREVERRSGQVEWLDTRELW